MVGKTGSPPLSFQERQYIEEALKKGHSQVSIARYLKRSQAIISMEVRKCGDKFKYNAIESQNISDERYQLRGVKKCRIFSEEEVLRIEQFIDEGRSLNYIATMLQVSRSTITNFVRRKGIIYESNSIHSHRDKIEGLEEQIKLIFELLQELKNGKN